MPRRHEDTKRDIGQSTLDTWYTYDIDNQLIGMDGCTDEGEHYTRAYTYDAFGRRLSATEDGVTRYFAYDGLDVIAEFNASGEVTKWYIRGSGLGGGIGDVVAEASAATLKYYSYNHRGDVVMVTDASGAVLARNEYMAFGAPLSNVERPMSKVKALGFSSKEYDTVSGLSYYGFRYYDAHSARWMAKDPAFVEYDVHQYRFVMNMPSVLGDEYGLQAIYPQRTRQLLVTYYGKVYEVFYAGDYCRCLRDAQRIYSTIKWSLGVPVQVVAWSPLGRIVTQSVKLAFRIIGTIFFLADNPAFSLGAIVAEDFCRSSVYQPRGTTSNGNEVPIKVTIDVPKPTAVTLSPLGSPTKISSLLSHPLTR